jgi:nucleotide-binding universal stress UspA family protein
MGIKTVLCPTDFSALSERELQLAIRLCQRFGAKLVVQHNLHNLPPYWLSTSGTRLETQPPYERDEEQQAELRLEQLLAKIPASVRSEAIVTHGLTEIAIASFARDLPADLIVMGTYGPSSAAHISITEQVVIHSPCAVLTTRDHTPGPTLPTLWSGAPGSNLQTLVPLDFTMHSLYTLEYAFRLMEILPMTLNLLHVEGLFSWDDIRSATHFNLSERRQQRLREAQEQLRALVPGNLADRVNIQVCLGSTVEKICDHAESLRADLVIMDTHPKGMLEQLVSGATSCEVLFKSQVPVWFVPTGKAERLNTAKEAFEVVHG